MFEIISQLNELFQRVRRLESLETPFSQDTVSAVAALPSPSAALAGARRFRSTDNIEFVCDGTRWLSTQLHEVSLVGKNASNVMTAPGGSGFLIITKTMPSDYDIWVLSISLGLVHFVSQSGTNFYNISATGLTLTANKDTKLDTGAPGVNYRIEPTFVPTLYAKTNLSFDVNFQQNGTPGNIEINGVLKYRLIG